MTDKTPAEFARYYAEILDAFGFKGGGDRHRKIADTLDAAREALGWFLVDPRFEVAVGGNPIAVARMMADARAALAKLGG